MYISTLQDIKGSKYNVLGIVYAHKYAEKYEDDDDVLDSMMADIIEELQEAAEDFDGADGVIGITITSCSTFNTDDDGNTYPDLMAFGSVIEFV